MKPVALSSMVVSVVLVAGFALGAGEKTDKQRLQGVWQATSIEADGVQAPAEVTESLTYTFKGDTLTMGPAAEPGSNSEFTITLDPAKKPKTIDLKITKGSGKGKTMLGIYKIEKDGLLICFSETRPTEFATKANSDTALVALKRKTAK